MTDDASAGGRCHLHAKRRARARCAVCGLELCRSCRQRRGDDDLCADCDASPPETGADQVNADGVALAAGAAGDGPLLTAGGNPEFSTPRRLADPSDRAHHADDDLPDAVDESRDEEDDPDDADAAGDDRIGDYHDGDEAGATPRLRLPAALYGFFVVQVAASVLVGYGLLALASARREGSPPAAPPLVAESAEQPLHAPTLDLPPEQVVYGGRVGPSGSAKNGEVVALLIDGEVVAVERILEGRFVFREIELPPGPYQISVIAYRRAGQPIESTPIELIMKPVEAGVPTPTPTAPRGKRATQGESNSPPLVPSDLLTPNPRNVVRGTHARRMALTFDGGSNAAQASAVLDALSTTGVRSTLFLTGEFISKYPELTRRIVRDGHEVGNHTLDHPHLALWTGTGHRTKEGVTREFLVSQLSETERRFRATTGQRMSTYWRAPFGEINSEILAWAAAEGWTHIGWTQGLDTLDWVADPNDRLYRSAVEIRERLVRHAREKDSARGGIVLMHLGAERDHDQASNELPRIIDDLRREGYELVTITKLLGT